MTGQKRGVHDIEENGKNKVGVEAEPATTRPRLEGGKRDAEGEPAEDSGGRRPRLEHRSETQAPGGRSDEAMFDVCELFSPPRVCNVAHQMGLSAGYSLGVTWTDAITGYKWNLLDHRTKTRLWQLLKSKRPRLLVASPPCTTFSALQNLRRTPMSLEERRQGEDLLRVAVKACLLQHKAGMYFLLEHPLSARSWREDCVRDLLKLEGVYMLDFDQCEYGLVSWDEHGEAPAMKPTRIITNIQHARVTLSRRCSRTHRHVHLVNGKAKHAQT